MKTGVSFHVLINELENQALSNIVNSANRLVITRSISIDQYYHVLNKSETEILFRSLEEIFKHIFELDIDDRKVRRRFSMITETKVVNNPRENDKKASNVSGDIMENSEKSS